MPQVGKLLWAPSGNQITCLSGNPIFADTQRMLARSTVAVTADIEGTVISSSGEPHRIDASTADERSSLIAASVSSMVSCTDCMVRAFLTIDSTTLDWLAAKLYHLAVIDNERVRFRKSPAIHPRCRLVLFSMAIMEAR